MTNLERLAAATIFMDTDERREFDNYLIGALSTVVSAEIWDKALKTAQQCANCPPDKTTRG